MKLALVGLFMLVVLVGITGLMAQEPKVLDGKTIFLAQKCETCHTVSSASITQKMKGSKAPDLTGLLATKDSKDIGAFLRKTGEIEGKKHPKAFTGSDEELGALIAWLQKQKK